MEKLINWSELSRHIIKGDRNGIRFNKIPQKHIEALDKLFNEELPKWWVEHKSRLAEKPEAGGEKIKIMGLTDKLSNEVQTKPIWLLTEVLNTDI